MDRFIARFAASEDQDLMICPAHGVAYQRDMDAPGVPYDDSYFENYQRLEGQNIAKKLNAARLALVQQWIGDQVKLVDVGIGSGEFIKTRGVLTTFGYDVNPRAEAWLRLIGRWAADLSVFSAFTFWDVIEHIKDPSHYFRNVPVGGYLFTSLPIFDDLTKVRVSRHYKPGEHLYYFTAEGFSSWMGLYGFRMLDRNDAETQAGRDSILSFAFQREAA